jgi:hypothetical protein
MIEEKKQAAPHSSATNTKMSTNTSNATHHNMQPPPENYLHWQMQLKKEQPLQPTPLLPQQQQPLPIRSHVWRQWRDEWEQTETAAT